MAFLSWTEELAVGVPVIDSQHKGLVDLIDGLHVAMASGQGKDVLGPTLDALMDYTRVHFSAEESLFEACRYPDITAHKAQHQFFISQVEEFRQGFTEDRLMLSLDVMNFLADWLIGHISMRDKVMAPFLREEGVA